MTKPPRAKNTPILSKWLMIRYVVTGLYVGFATIGVFVWWYLDKGVTFQQLGNLLLIFMCNFLVLNHFLLIYM
jgi:magnesium-transporting ATPase (P-type)